MFDGEEEFLLGFKISKLRSSEFQNGDCYSAVDVEISMGNLCDRCLKV